MKKTTSKIAKDLEKEKKKNQERNEDESKDFELFKSNMANRLRDSIFRKNSSISEFAKKCNLPYDTVKKYVSKQRLISANNIVVMARELGVSCDYLLGVTNDTSNQRGLSINETIRNETNLTDDAISVLVSLKNENDYINCISTMLSEKTILEKFVKYYIFLQNKGINENSAKNQDAYKNYRCMVDSTNAELESSSEYEHLPIGETINLGNIYLYQLMKEFEKAVERKIKKNK